MVSVVTARELARQQLADALPRRWQHVQAVGRLAEEIAERVTGGDADTLAAAAWLHDIGYAPSLE